MKILVFFILFLLLSQVVMAVNITLPNITIRIPDFNTSLSNLTLINQTRVNDIIEIVNIRIYEVLEDRLNRVIDYVLNRIAENIANSIPRIIEILLKGNTTSNS